MSDPSTHEPHCEEGRTPSVELTVGARLRDLGGFSVRRVLPSPKRRTVGPFAFFDHMGPTDFDRGAGIDVRPHPHIGLATVTYLFDGEIVHRDNLGSTQAIRPGDVNWMIAGRGIAHSERTAEDRRQSGGALHGIQSWLALPAAEQERAPSFDHHPASTIPRVALPGLDLRVVAGAAYGATSPVNVLSPTLYVAAELEERACLPIVDEPYLAKNVSTTLAP
jgi:redox-sensitive bicupin YhaK (pirin superfamily)